MIALLRRDGRPYETERRASPYLDMLSGDLENSLPAKVGLAFAKALVSGDYLAAHQMLARELRDDLQPDGLKAQYEQMTSYFDAPVNRIKVSHVDPPWSSRPGKEESDVGWAYVSIDSIPPDAGACLEAVCVRVVLESGHYLIGQVEWGRP